MTDPLLMELGVPLSTTKKPVRAKASLHQSPGPTSESKGGFKIIGYGPQLMMTSNKFNFKRQFEDLSIGGGMVTGYPQIT